MLKKKFTKFNSDSKQLIKPQRKNIFLFFTLFLILLFSTIITIIPVIKATTLILNNSDSYDFSTNTRDKLTGGDFYYGDSQFSGNFWANNLGQRGLVDLGDIGDVALNFVILPSSGFTRFGVAAVVNHTYVSLAQEGEEGNHIIFRVQSFLEGYSGVILQYYYSDTPVSSPTPTPTVAPTLSPSASPTATPAEPTPTPSPEFNFPVGFVIGGISAIVVVVIVLFFLRKKLN